MGDKGDKGEKRDKERLEFAGIADRDRVAEYLSRLADGLRLGAVTLSSAGQSVHLEAAERLRLEVEARHRPDKGSSSLQLEISWKTASAVREADEELLTIEPARPGSPPRTASPAHAASPTTERT